MIEREVQNRLHKLFHPLVRTGLTVIHVSIGGLIKQKREHGWRSDFTKRMDRALQRVSLRIGIKFKDLADDATRLFEIGTVLSDLEREHFPRWIYFVLDELNKESINLEELKKIYGGEHGSSKAD